MAKPQSRLTLRKRYFSLLGLGWSTTAAFTKVEKTKYLSDAAFNEDVSWSRMARKRMGPTKAEFLRERHRDAAKQRKAAFDLKKKVERNRAAAVKRAAAFKRKKRLSAFYDANPAYKQQRDLNRRIAANRAAAKKRRIAFLAKKRYSFHK